MTHRVLYDFDIFDLITICEQFLTYEVLDVTVHETNRTFVRQYLTKAVIKRRYFDEGVDRLQRYKYQKIF